MPRRNMQLLLIVAIVSVICYEKAGSSQRSRYGPMVETLIETLDQIDRHYVERVDRRELFEGALAGILNKLDEYSAFYGPEENNGLQEEFDQQFGGIGIQVSLPAETKQLTVLSPLVGTPAYEAGVLAGDKIVAIDGQSTDGFVIDDALRLLRGRRGEKVRLTVLHEGDDKPVELEIERAIIQVDTVLGDTRNPDNSWNFLLDGTTDIAYIRIMAFYKQTSDELERAITWLRHRQPRALVLDLRDNAGGLLHEAVEVCDQFLDEGRIVSTLGRGGDELETFDAEPGSVFTNLPMAVLVNRYSASAAEIVAACLQDHHRAIVVGERTWGKGSVQSVIDLERGKSALKLTTATYWRPSRRNIHRHKDDKDTDLWGVTPDPGFEVKLSNEDFEKTHLDRRQRDIVGRPTSASATNGSTARDTPRFDPQLQRAVEYLESKLAAESSTARRAAH